MYTYNTYCFSFPILVSGERDREYPKRAVNTTALEKTPSLETARSTRFRPNSAVRDARATEYITAKFQLFALNGTHSRQGTAICNRALKSDEHF